MFCGILCENFYKIFYCYINMCYFRWSRSWFNMFILVGRILDIFKKKFVMISFLNLFILFFLFFICCNSWCWSWKLLWIKWVKKNNLKNFIVFYVLFVFCMCYIYFFFICLNGWFFVCVLYLFVFNFFFIGFGCK